METKKFIKEKLNEEFNPNKRSAMVRGIMDKCINHLFDAYRELDLAIQYCDNPEVREKLELIRRGLGKDNDISGFVEPESTSVISDLQGLAKNIKV